MSQREDDSLLGFIEFVARNCLVAFAVLIMLVGLMVALPGLLILKSIDELE